MIIENLYPTPLGRFCFVDSTELNRGLSDFIYSIRNEDSPQRSMRGGYHTNEDLLSRDNVFIKQFHGKISDQIFQYLNKIGVTYIGPNTKIASWAMIYGQGHYAECHTHAGADISSAYYCKVPKDLKTNEGNFIHVDPRSSAQWDRNFQTNSTQEISIQEGYGIIFPGWLTHKSQYSDTEEPRYVIAADSYVGVGE